MGIAHLLNEPLCVHHVQKDPLAEGSEGDSALLGLHDAVLRAHGDDGICEIGADLPLDGRAVHSRRNLGLYLQAVLHGFDEVLVAGIIEFVEQQHEHVPQYGFKVRLQPLEFFDDEPTHEDRHAEGCPPLRAVHQGVGFRAHLGQSWIVGVLREKLALLGDKHGCGLGVAHAIRRNAEHLIHRPVADGLLDEENFLQIIHTAEWH